MTRHVGTGTYGVIIRETAQELGLKPMHVRRVMEHLLEVLRDHVWQDGRVLVPRLGSFRVKERKGRSVVAPGKLRADEIPAHRAVTFRAAKNWRRRNS